MHLFTGGRGGGTVKTFRAVIKTEKAGILTAEDEFCSSDSTLQAFFRQDSTAREWRGIVLEKGGEARFRIVRTLIFQAGTAL